MMEYYHSLSAMEAFYAGCALFGGILFLIRTVLMFVGEVGDMDVGEDGLSVPDDADASFKVLSLQSLTAFFMMFGLVALALSRQAGWGHWGSVLGGGAAGAFAVWLIGRIFLGMHRLQADGTLRIENAVGQAGEIYLNIAPGKTGQVRVTVQGQLRVFDAVAAEGVGLQTGDRVVVDRVLGGNVLVVKQAGNKEVAG
ncbi:MAG: hypothetical protein ABR497_13085 [Kiritimatiellia bacterium]